MCNVLLNVTALLHCLETNLFENQIYTPDTPTN